MRTMNPQTAIERLTGRGWTMVQIAKSIRIGRSSVYRVLNGEQLLTYEKAIELIDLAKSGRKYREPTGETA